MPGAVTPTGSIALLNVALTVGVEQNVDICVGWAGEGYRRRGGVRPAACCKAPRIRHGTSNQCIAAKVLGGIGNRDGKLCAWSEIQRSG